MPPELEAQAGLSAEELESELATDLPEREALSIVDPGVFSVLPATLPVDRTAATATRPDGGVQDLPPSA